MIAFLWRVATIIIPVPLAALVVVSGWLWIDKHSFARKAVNSAVTRLVAGAELDAAKADAAAMAAIAGMLTRQLKETTDRAEKEQATRHEFEVKLALSEAENKDLESELDDVLSQPPAPDGLVDDRLYGRMRNK